MKRYHLRSQHESNSILVFLFGANVRKGTGSKLSAKFQVSEDFCFGKEKWLDVGEIVLQPGELEPGDDAHAPIERALKFGSYEWQLPALETLSSNAFELVLPTLEKPKEKSITSSKARVVRALEAVAAVAVRCGLSSPIFDASAVTDMPFRRPTTIIADTSSVLHGGLDFVVRFLYPMARIRVPAVVHMEILNFVDRYFSQRRKRTGGRASALLDHVMSQGGQRVLLRLELQTDAEIERPRVGADPLRGIFYPEKDAEDSSLGLQAVQRSFADRLILEAAIQHRARSNPDHPIMLLTSDQGLSRMTLGEGLQPLYFNKDHSLSVFDSTLSGTCFCPFASLGASDRLRCIPITELLWEMAVTFGSARLLNSNSKAVFEICALGEDISWNPYHAQDDLLWVATDGIELGVPIPIEVTSKESIPGDLSSESVKKAPSPEGKPRKVSYPLKGSYKFSLNSMILLIRAFIEHEELSDQEGMETVGVKTRRRYVEFKSFLRAGGFVVLQGKTVAKRTELLCQLWESMKNREFQTMQRLLSRVPSFKNFLNGMKVGSAINSGDLQSVSKNAFNTYVSLAEISCSGLNISGEGVYLTPFSVDIQEFAKIAIRTYQQIAKGEKYILTGQWLESLAREQGIHPVISRDKLNESRQAGLLERFTEGSTPETQFESHTMYYLTPANGSLSVKKINLYHGDFLIPDRTSVSIRLEARNL